MTLRRAKIVSTAALAAAAFLFASPVGARPMSVRALAAQEVRLATIAYRIAAANPHACSTPETLTGLVLHDLLRYDASIRPAVSSAFSLNGGFGVLQIVPNSVAAEAGLQVDDEILAVGQYSVEDQQALKRPKSYQRMEWFQAVVRSALKYGKTELRVRRAGTIMNISLRAQYGCGGLLTLSNSPTMNAWADGRHVVVTTGMNSLSRSEDEIAFVIAHEMAHNMLGHSERSAGPQGIFGIGRIRRGEVEADRHAVHLMANAGYEPGGGISFLRNARQRLWWNISLDHPGFGQRLAAVAAAMEARRASALNWVNVRRLPVPATVNRHIVASATVDTRL